MVLSAENARPSGRSLTDRWVCACDSSHSVHTRARQRRNILPPFPPAIAMPTPQQMKVTA